MRVRKGCTDWDKRQECLACVWVEPEMGVEEECVWRNVVNAFEKVARAAHKQVTKTAEVGAVLHFLGEDV